MQKLKDETREKIIAAGRDQFMRRGFAAASMREIARSSGIAVGNLYRYFTGKEALFEAVVQPAYRSLLSLVRSDRQLDREALRDFRSVQPVTDLLLRACQEYRTEVLILADQSAGTRYGGTRGVLVRAIERRLSTGLRLGRKGHGRAEDFLILHVLAATFVEGFLMILRKKEPRAARLDGAVRRLLALFFKDIAARMA
jgi:AcrR family transcriptional regulator